jgi:hypothetical protein
MAILFTLTKVVAQSDRWDLPGGRLLDTILSSCQFEHSSREGVDVEHMICPTRLGASAFPQVLKDAVVASEDDRFYAHGAIDHPATLRAAWHFSLGDRQGGSTITQQLARSILLKKEDSLERKLTEAVLAIRIYARLSRSEILSRYMNVVPHARNMYGFDDPARYYFGVGVQDLTLAEAALLVGMLPEPNNRDPLKNPSAALESTVSVLQRMVAEKKIALYQAARAEDELKRRIRDGKLRRGNQIYTRLEYRPYRDLALREANANGIKLPEDYRLIVFIDPEFQQTLQAQICSITGAYQGAGFFMRPSGEALALTGSCTYTGEWNRATDIARSIGSTGKLFPLIGVHEAGLSLNERFSTWPLRRSSWPAEPNPLCRSRAKVTLEFALAQSCNRPWTEAAMLLGPRVIEIVKRFGITPPNAPSLVPIGGVQTSPMKLAQAYASLENDGMLPQIRFLIAAIGPRGNIVGMGGEGRTTGDVDGDRNVRPSGLARAGQARHCAGGKLGPRPRLRQDRDLFPQRGRPVRRTDGRLCRQHLARLRPASADARHSRRRHAGKGFRQAHRLLLPQARASPLRGGRGDGIARVALGQTEGFRRKAARDRRHDDAWLRGDVVLLAAGFVPAKRAHGKRAVPRTAAGRPRPTTSALSATASAIVLSAGSGGGDEGEQALEQGFRRRRAARDVQIDGDDLRHAAFHRVASGENAAVGGAIADRYHPFRVGRRGVGALQRLAHVLGDRACHQQHIGMAWRGDEAQAEALEIVEGVVKRVDLELASVARPGIDLADGEAPAKLPPRGAIEICRKLGQGRVVRLRRRLGHASTHYILEEKSTHVRT